ncbi:MAG: hypothetical protein ACRC7V_08150, partial [Lachnospiraceae bacterium]
DGYAPTYTRTDLTDKLHESFGFRTDYQIISQRNIKKICTSTKKEKNTTFKRKEKVSQVPYMWYL